MTRTRAIATILLAGTAGAAAWGAEPEPAAPRDERARAVQIDEWEVPRGGRPRDPYAAAADAVWFVGQEGHYLARLTPSTGELFFRPLDDEPGAHNLIVGDDGIVWYAGNLKGYIGRYDPRTDEITRIPMPDDAVRDPHTLTFDATGHHIWFTAQHGNRIGRLTIASGHVDLIDVPTASARPYGIRIAPDGTPWIVLFGTNRLASVDPRSLELREYEIPAAKARPRRIEITSDGRIWYGDYLRGFLGVYDPKDGRFREFPLPAGAESAPYGMAVDAEDRVWVVETGVQPNRLVGFDTRTERVVSTTPIPSGGGTVRHMDYDAGTHAVWFGTDAGTVGRARVADSAPSS
jgi:virginiamycin B lyase